MFFADKMKKPIKRILGGIAVAFLAIVAYIGFDMWQTVKRIPEAYAAWDSATLVIEYMDTHDGTWPQSWEGLFSAARTLPNSGRILCGHDSNTLSRITRLVRIDWSADPRIMARARYESEKIPFHVITRADGSDFPVLWSGKEPNTLVWEYLRQKAATNTSEVICQPANGLPISSM